MTREQIQSVSIIKTSDVPPSGMCQAGQTPQPIALMTNQTPPNRALFKSEDGAGNTEIEAFLRQPSCPIARNMEVVSFIRKSINCWDDHFIESTGPPDYFPHPFRWEVTHHSSPPGPSVTKVENSYWKAFPVMDWVMYTGKIVSKGVIKSDDDFVAEISGLKYISSWLTFIGHTRIVFGFDIEETWGPTIWADVISSDTRIWRLHFSGDVSHDVNVVNPSNLCLRLGRVGTIYTGSYSIAGSHFISLGLPLNYGPIADDRMNIRMGHHRAGYVPSGTWFGINEFSFVSGSPEC